MSPGHRRNARSAFPTLPLTFWVSVHGQWGGGLEADLLSRSSMVVLRSWPARIAGSVLEFSDGCSPLRISVGCWNDLSLSWSDNDGKGAKPVKLCNQPAPNCLVTSCLNNLNQPNPTKTVANSLVWENCRNRSKPGLHRVSSSNVHGHRTRSYGLPLPLDGARVLIIIKCIWIKVKYLEMSLI
jgi:hypothetical protein